MENQLFPFELFDEDSLVQIDFFSNNIFSTFDGVLGLDFLRNNKICFDFRKSVITMS
jgi:hypothetical protein